MPDTDCDVAIVGGGPVGLTAAILLGRLGLRTVLLERNPSTSVHPRGHVVNARSMEILRTLGIEEEVKAASVPLERHLGVAFVTRIAGDEIGSLRYRGDPASDALETSISPSVKRSCPQDVLEPILRREAARQPGVTLRFGTGVAGLQQDGDAVRLQLEGAADTVAARRVIAADGARSTLRRALGVEMGGLGRMGHQIGVHFEADLWPWIADRPYLLWWVYNPDSSGLFIALDGCRRWTFNFAYDPATASPADFDAVRCTRMIRAAVGVEDLPVAIRTVQPWRMQARLADRFRIGNVFLAGDAAHPLPPTGGQGMNTGIADVHNLCWKLALVNRGLAGEALLDSYEAERRPAAKANVDQSVKNATSMAKSGLGGMLANDTDLLARLEGPEGALARARLAAEIPAQREHFDYHGQTFGFGYVSPGIVDDGSPPVPFSIHHYEPSARPGHRAPHCWLTRDGERISTVDLSVDRRFTLLSGSAGEARCDAFHRIATEAGLEAQAFRIGIDLADPEGHFAGLYGIGDEGAVLIRPDGHVAWRTPAAADDTGAELRHVVAQVVYRSISDNPSVVAHAAAARRVDSRR